MVVEPPGDHVHYAALALHLAVHAEQARAEHDRALALGQRLPHYQVDVAALVLEGDEGDVVGGARALAGDDEPAGAYVLAVAALVAAQGESLRNLVLDAGAIAAVLAVPIIVGLARWSASGRAATGAIIAQLLVLGVLDYVMGVPGAFLWMIAAGAAVFALITLAHRKPAPARA